jgi:hypothetical protein
MNTQKGTIFDSRGRALQHAAQLGMEGKPGTYSLCRGRQRWELLHTATSDSQPIAVADEHLIRAAVNELLAWHKNHCSACIEASSETWDFCEEAQTLFLQS